MIRVDKAMEKSPEGTKKLGVAKNLKFKYEGIWRLRNSEKINSESIKPCLRRLSRRKKNMVYVLPLISFLVCLILTPVVRRLALEKGWMAEPSQDRWHQKPTPLLGGVAIYMGLSVSFFLQVDFGVFFHQLAEIGFRQQVQDPMAVIWTGGTGLFLLGLLDDFINITPTTKFVGQLLVACIMIYLGFRLHWVTSLYPDMGLTLIWIIGITNAFNLLDNMDGLCAGVGTVAALVLGILFMDGAPQTALTAFILAGTLGAFLIYNFKPASIYMGDCGSLVIGFIIAMLCLQYPEAGESSQTVAWAVPVLIMLVPIFDTTLVTLARLHNGCKVSTGGRDHTSHRLVYMGLSERQAVLFLYGIGAVAGAAAIFINQIGDLPLPALFIPLTLTILYMGIYLARLRVYPEKKESFRTERPDL